MTGVASVPGTTLHNEGEARVSRRRRRRLALVAIVLAGLSYATVIQSFSWNQTSHYDLIRSIYAGHATIDRYQDNTGDKVLYHGHYYSARAPGLALLSLPFYAALRVVNANALARELAAQRGDDEMIYFIGLWANVLPAFLLLLLAWRVCERFEPGYGAAAAITLGLGTMVLPLATLLFSHVLSTLLGFAAFALLVRERAGPPSWRLTLLAGLAMGYAVTCEYPLFFVGAILGLFLLSRPGGLAPRALLTRAGTYIGGGIVGIVPLLLYNHFAFHSWTHLAYSDVPRQQKGFFGIGAPSLHVLATLLLDSRGLLTISPVLLMGAIGTVLMYKRGRRAEALCIGAICLCYVGYNSGYYLPFGGGFMGPRFLTTMLPFLAPGLAIAFKRYPGPTIALAAVSIAATVIATLTHPLVGYENETVIWGKLLLGKCSLAAPAPPIVGCASEPFQPTIVSALGLGRSYGAIVPFVLAAGGAVLCAAYACARRPLASRAVAVGALAVLAWALFAAFAPTLLGIDHRGLQSIVGAGDHTALNLPLHDGTRYPLRALVPIAAAAAVAALAGARLWRARGSAAGSVPPAPASASA
jgi:hypothetical protein